MQDAPKTMLQTWESPTTHCRPLCARVPFPAAGLFSGELCRRFRQHWAPANCRRAVRRWERGFGSPNKAARAVHVTPFLRIIFLHCLQDFGTAGRFPANRFARYYCLGRQKAVLHTEPSRWSGSTIIVLLSTSIPDDTIFGGMTSTRGHSPGSQRAKGGNFYFFIFLGSREGLPPT
jgi:hypothetical protein